MSQLDGSHAAYLSLSASSPQGYELPLDIHTNLFVSQFYMFKSIPILNMQDNKIDTLT